MAIVTVRTAAMADTKALIVKVTPIKLRLTLVMVIRTTGGWECMATILVENRH